ncbi:MULTISPECIES: fimbria/pilus outer membrane usher protein [unclassified Pseudomonas]|uniref:fimbria/pilus outer membrane usher protein n=1 Tax=unclassified Pseudomonas TaxID=196821 RepID=UPI000C88B4D6|nr:MULTISPECIES: fimbria/pilus outer membrane usher protein [unclassified Pseudomonas]PNA85192.1 ferrous iron transporter B [Pseudomonas sp. GW460-5]PNB53512.1 ferrous iron transporter B [Pseudomonas sp. FW305-130]
MLLPPTRRLLLSRLRITTLVALGSGSLLIAPQRPASASPQFDASFMRQAPDQPADAGALALQALAAETPLAPGRYRLEVWVNLVFLAEQDVRLQKIDGHRTLRPCLNATLLRQAGLREQSLAQPLPDDDSCIDLEALAPGATTKLDSGRLRLELSIPQAFMIRQAGRMPSAEQWDYGINAAFINYQASAQMRSLAHGGSQSSQDLNLSSGLNLGPWRLRSSQSLREDEHGSRRWTHTNTYAQRDLPGSFGTLTLGETFSNSDVFRSQPFKGLQLASELGMLPDVMQNYAPIIRGVAQTRAKLEVLHNGYPIYTTYVAPGPYEIDDLAVGGGSGELEIVLTEADGQVRRFIQPYSSLSNLLREGVWRYSATFGRYNGAEDLDAPLLWQATLARGTSLNTTLYGGVQGGDYYRAATVGAARDLGTLGALSLDVTRAETDLGNTLGQVHGHSFAARYGKAFDTGTNLRFAGYRYSTEGYRDYDEAVRERNAYSAYRGSRRSRLEASAHQRLGSRSSLSFTMTQDDYWQSGQQLRQYQLQLSTSWHNVSYNLYASQSLNERSQNDRMFGLSVSLPLGFGRASSANISLQSHNGEHSQRASFSSSAMDRRLSYLASTSRDARRNQTSAFSANYRGANASLGAGYTQSDDYRTLSLNASGSLLLHESGLTLGRYLGETNALVHVPDVAGVGVKNNPESRSDSSGHMVVPYLRPYRSNLLELNTDDLGPQVHIDNGAQHLIPRRGAIVLAEFQARKVSRLILTLFQANGRPMPFGTQVNDISGTSLGVVGQAGQALLAVEDKPQTLHVRWGEANDEQCQLQIEPASMEQTQGYHQQTLNCPTT